MLLGLSSSFAGVVKKESKKKIYVPILIPGTTHCGLGNINGKSKLRQLNAVCKEHDKSKGYLQGRATKYIPGMGNKDVQKADKKLIYGMAGVITSKNASVKERLYAGAAGSYFAAKNRVDQTVQKTRRTYQSVKNKTKSRYAKTKVAVKARFSRARKVYRTVKNRTKSNRYKRAKAAAKNRLNQTRKRTYQSAKNRTRNRYTRTKAALKRRFRRRR